MSTDPLNEESRLISDVEKTTENCEDDSQDHISINTHQHIITEHEHGEDHGHVRIGSYIWKFLIDLTEFAYSGGTFEICSFWTGLILFGPFYVPILGAAGLLIIFVPFALIYELMEHRTPWLWLLATIVIQLGGLADLGADLYLLIKILVNGHFSNGGFEPGIDKNDEFDFTVTRAFLTLLSGVYPLLLLYMAYFFHNQTKTKGKGSSTTVKLGAILLFVVAIVAKGAFFLVRLALLIWTICRMVQSKGHLTNKDKLTIQIVECGLLLDVLAGALPLGILTGLEMVVEIHEKGAINILSHHAARYEIVKLTALGIDLTAASYLIFFCILNMSNLWRKRHTHHHQHQ